MRKNIHRPKFLFLFLVSSFALTACASSQASKQKQEKFEFDFNDFIGDEIAYHQPVSANLMKLNLTLLFPPNHRLLTKAKPHIRLFTLNDGLIAKFPIDESISHFPINEEIASNRLYAEVALFYCKDDATGLCLVKNVLYKISVDSSLEAQDLDIVYHVP